MTRRNTGFGLLAARAASTSDQSYVPGEGSSCDQRKIQESPWHGEGPSASAVVSMDSTVLDLIGSMYAKHCGCVVALVATFFLGLDIAAGRTSRYTIAPPATRIRAAIPMTATRRYLDGPTPLITINNDRPSRSGRRRTALAWRRAPCGDAHA